MKRHPRLSFFLLWGLAVLCLVPLFFRPQIWPVCLVLNLLCVGGVVYGNLRVNCKWFGLVVTDFRAGRKEVWLTIDDAPDPRYTPETLRQLKRSNARATFFMIGDRVQAHPELARAILDQGHTVANHSATHPYTRFWALLSKAAVREIDGGAMAIKEATGVNPQWFRAPVGMANCFVHAALRDRQMVLIGWSARGLDGVAGNPAQVVEKLFREIRPGAIVLLHEASSTQAVPPGKLTVLETLLTRLKAEGYSCVIPEPEQLCAPSATPNARPGFKTAGNQKLIPNAS